MYRATSKIEIDFDQPLHPMVSLIAANWTGDSTYHHWSCLGGSIAGSMVTLSILWGAGAGFMNMVSYAASPPQVHNVYGNPAAPFTNYPATLLP